MDVNNEIKILLVDDHMVVRKGLRMVIAEASDLSVVGEAENGEEAIYLSRKLKPDVVLMDVKMDGMDGTEVTSLIAQHHGAVRVIGLSTFADQHTIETMIHAGARGYLFKDVSSAELTDAIRRVHAGEVLFPDDFEPTGQSEEALEASNDAPKNATLLGDQQRRVLALMTKGLTNPEIADQLNISISTARYHVSAILRKLDVSNRSEAVGMALRLNLISSDDI